jgi:hypothetical protein
MDVKWKFYKARQTVSQVSSQSKNRPKKRLNASGERRRRSSLVWNLLAKGK